MIRHRQIHVEKKPYVCEDCGKVFSHMASHKTIRQHRQIHTGEKLDESDEVKPGENSHGNQLHIEDCGQEFATKQNLEAHHMTHTGNTPLEFQSVEGDEYPIVPLLEDDSVKPEKHEEIPIEIETKMEVETGKNSHENPLQCEDCGLQCKSKSAFENHRRVHTGERPFKCEDCGKAFRQKSALKSHRRIHTGEEPYKCDLCDETFRTGFAIEHTGRPLLNCHKINDTSSLFLLVNNVT